VPKDNNAVILISLDDGSTLHHINANGTTKEMIAYEDIIDQINSSYTTTLTPTPAAQLPNLIDGYSWVTCEGMKAKFLKPDGWYFKEDKVYETNTCFITKEQIAWPLPTSEYETGLTVSATPNIPQKTGQPVSEFAFDFINQAESWISDHFGSNRNISQQSEVTTASLSNSGGNFNGTSYRRFITVDNPATKVVLIVTTNDSTGTMYTMLFESPELKWEENKETGEQITTIHTLDNTF